MSKLTAFVAKRNLMDGVVIYNEVIDEIQKKRIGAAILN